MVHQGFIAQDKLPTIELGAARLSTLTWYGGRHMSILTYRRTDQVEPVFIPPRLQENSLAFIHIVSCAKSLR